MKICKKNSFLLPGLIVGIGFVPAGGAMAQTFGVVKSFGILTNITGFNPQSTLVQGPDGTLYGSATYGEASVAGTVFKMQPDGNGFTVLKFFTNSLEGANPYRGLALASNVLYGTTAYGGSSNLGTVFKINTDGTGYAVLKNFTGSGGANPFYTGLILSGSMLYGATYHGGAAGNGTVFQINTDGTGFRVLKNFSGSDGANPNAALTLSGNVLYGTTEQGGSSGGGTVFSVNTDGTGYTVLNHFTGLDGDGRSPDGVLTLSGSVLYGTTYYGGSQDAGTVFKVNTDGTSYAVLKRFDYGNDGARPSGDLLLSGGVLFGTTSQGDSSGIGLVLHGTVFKMNADGTGYTVLKNFAGSDGATSDAGLVLSGHVLYGTTAQGGSGGNGTVFQVNTDGTGYTVLKNFTYSDAATPHAPLTMSGNVLYGTAYRGGSSGNGAVFKVNIDGSGPAILHSFTDDSFGSGSRNSDGAWPQAGLVLSGNTLYGTAQIGGYWHVGTVFAVNTDGSGFTNLHTFTPTNSDGTQPLAGLILSGNTLYGTTYKMDSGSGNGSVFAVNTDGTGFTNLHSFTALSYDPGGTNTDGAHPRAGLVLTGTTLYGTASEGGSSGGGTVFAVNTDDTGFALLHDFTPVSAPYYTNGDGGGPYAGLILSGSTLYGTTAYNGNSGYGTVFKVKTDGTGFTTLHSFNGGSDGAYPAAGLLLSSNTLYGTTAFNQSGGAGSGTVFALSTDGTTFTTLHSFTQLSAPVSQGGTNSDGANPSAGLILSGNALYGTAQNGGALGEGTIFSISFRPQLSITPAGTNLILSWPTNVAGFDYTGYTLQSTTNLVPPVVWVTNSPASLVINGQNTVTEPTSATQKFYRLVQ